MNKPYRVKLEIVGLIAGNIWMPAVECEKDFRVDPDAYPHGGEDTLREIMLRVTNDGDFRSARIRYGQILATVTRNAGRYTKRRVRAFDLSRFPSIADLMEKDDCQWLGE